MDIIVKLSDDINDLNGVVEVMQLSERFDNAYTPIEEMVKVENRLLQGSYRMSIESFLNSVNAAKYEFSSISTPILPRNCIKFSQSVSHSYVFVEIPKQRWDITYHKESFTKVGFPRMIFKYKVIQTEPESIKINIETIVAVKGNSNIISNTPLYHFPFSHVDTNGHVCMGGNELPDIKRVDQVSSLHNVFLSAPFGDDYGVKVSKPGVTLRELFNQLSNNDFDEYLLRDKNISFDQL